MISDDERREVALYTDPRDRGCECEVYVCPSCGRVSLLDAKKVVE